MSTAPAERTYEDGFRDGHQAAAAEVLPALRLALDRLDLSDYDGDEAESMALVQKAITYLESFGAQ